jgi:hypothetical protein
MTLKPKKPLGGASNKAPTPPSNQDIHGVAPGEDLEWKDKRVQLRFSGHFYMIPHIAEVELYRNVVIFLAYKEAFLCYDLEHGNIYTVRREDMLSLGCRMTVEIKPLDFVKNGTLNILKFNATAPENAVIARNPAYDGPLGVLTE